MTKHTIIGTAGHIDHGKTALIKALTGIDTDVLKQEKERGITIELGFAYWKENITIIDVPGHERFVKTMVAGVSTIDLFLLVIAADDGIMPQTVEHLDILGFFGVKDGIVALNKIDLADEEWLTLVQLDIEEFLKARGYENIPVIPVSAVSGKGIEELKQVLAQKIEHCALRQNNRPFRLNVDRSFSVHGAGTVVTGTVLSDQINVDDLVTILPSGKQSRVRGLQVHQKNVTSAHLGQRVAVNLSGVSKEEAARGVTLIRPNTLEPVTEFLATIHTASAVPVKIKKHQEVRVHLGTSELFGRITWVEEEAFLRARGTYHARIRLEKPGVCVPDDAVLIRSISPFYTIAGGRVTLVSPPPFGKVKQNWQKYFQIPEKGDLKETLKLFFEFAGFKAVTLFDIARRFFEKTETMEKIVQKLEKEKFLLKFTHHGKAYYSARAVTEKAEAELLKLIRLRSAKSHFDKGFNRMELWNLFKSLKGDELFFDRVLQRTVNKGILIKFGESFFTQEQAKLNQRRSLAEELLPVFKEAGFQPPSLQVLAERHGVKIDALKLVVSDLVKSGKLHSLQNQLYIHDDHMQRLLQFLRDYFKTRERIDIAAVKSFTGVSRKFLIPLLEYLDQQQFTVREGDTRKKGQRLWQ